LADLASEEGMPDAELARCALEAGLPGDRQESPDALLCARVSRQCSGIRLATHISAGQVYPLVFGA
jgi:hypothetical protein